MKLLRVLWISCLGLAFVAAQAPARAHCQTLLTVAGLHCAMPCCAKAMAMPRKCPMRQLASAQNTIAAREGSARTNAPDALRFVHAALIAVTFQTLSFLRPISDTLRFLFLERPALSRAPPLDSTLLSA